MSTCRERIMDGGGDCMPCGNTLPCVEHTKPETKVPDGITPTVSISKDELREQCPIIDPYEGVDDWCTDGRHPVLSPDEVWLRRLANGALSESPIREGAVRYRRADLPSERERRLVEALDKILRCTDDEEAWNVARAALKEP